MEDEIATQIGSTDAAGTESGTVVLAVQERIESNLDLSLRQ
jgi:hypothetical protein